MSIIPVKACPLLSVSVCYRIRFGAEWDNSPTVFQVNRLTARAVSIPYNTVEG